MHSNVRRYRAFYAPKDGGGYPVPTDSGVLPFVQIQASDAESAQRAAFALTGCSIAEVQRLDDTDYLPKPDERTRDLLAAAHRRAQAARFAS